MRPNKIGQIAKFHTPLPKEDPFQLYVVLEVIEDVERPRAKIKALGDNSSFASVNSVFLECLEVVKVDTTDLLGHDVTINKADFSQVTGKVVDVSEQKIMLDLTKVATGVETNVWLTVLDENGQEHVGTLFVNQLQIHAHRFKYN